MKEKKEKTPMDKAKKKKIIKRCILGGIVAVIVLYVGINSVIAKNTPAIVYTTEVVKGDVEQVLSTSGTVKTQESKTYFADISVKIGQVDVAAGDNVKKGQQLYAYDADALADEKMLSELKIQSNEGGYESSMIKNNKYISELGEANINLGVLEQQIADSENYVKELNQKITDKQNALAYEGALLQISLLDWSNEMSSEEYLELGRARLMSASAQLEAETIEYIKETVTSYPV